MNFAVRLLSIANLVGGSTLPITSERSSFENPYFVSLFAILQQTKTHASVAVMESFFHIVLNIYRANAAVIESIFKPQLYRKFNDALRTDF